MSIIDGNEINLNKYILSKSLDWSNHDSDDYKKALLSVRLEGYLRYNNLNQREECISLIKRIRENEGYRYEVPRIRKNFNTMIGLSYLPTGILLIATLAVFLIFSYKLVFIINKRAERFTAVEKVIVAVIWLATAYITCLLETVVAPNYANDLKGCYNCFLIIVMVPFFLACYVYRIDNK